MMDKENGDGPRGAAYKQVDVRAYGKFSTLVERKIDLMKEHVRFFELKKPYIKQ